MLICSTIPLLSSCITNLIVATAARVAEHIHTTGKGINLLLNHNRGGRDGGRIAASSRGTSEGTGVSQESLEGLGLIEGEGLKSDNDGDASLEGVANGVSNGGLSGVANLKRDSSHSVKGLSESGHNDVLVDGKNGSREDGSVVVHRVDDQTVGKGADSELGEEGSLRGTDLVTGLDQLNSGSDLDLTLLNLGRDLKDLEKGGLSRVAASGTGRNHNIDGGDGTGTGRGRHSVGQNDVLDLTKVAVGENHTDISVDLLIDGSDGVAGVGLHEVLQHLTDKGVLSHKDLSLTTHLEAGIVHLLGTDIVDLHEEHLGVGAQQDGESLHVHFLLGFGKRHLLEFRWGLKTEF